LVVCPYYKRNPNDPDLHVCCHKPRQLKRIKEHVQRVHLKAVQCQKCGTRVGINSQLDEKHKTEKCQKRPREEWPKVDKDDEEKHNALKDVRCDWTKIYLALFPETEIADVPNPYSDDSSKDSMENIASQFVDYLNANSISMEEGLLRFSKLSLQLMESESGESSVSSPTASSANSSVPQSPAMGSFVDPYHTADNVPNVRNIARQHFDEYGDGHSVAADGGKGPSESFLLFPAGFDPSGVDYGFDSVGFGPDVLGCELPWVPQYPE